MDTPAHQPALVSSRELFTTPNSVYGNSMETSVHVQSYQLAPCLEVVVAAERGGSTAPGRVLREDTAAWPSRGILCSSLVSPWVRAAPGTGYVHFSMAGLDTLIRAQWDRGDGSDRWLSLRTHGCLKACFYFLLREGGAMGEE